ncbi:flagellar hook-associated protein FlgK [Candidatus Nitrospira bockiana]
MSGISNLFNIGWSGLSAYQKSLSVTSHNMSNVHTKGYSRQEAILSEALPLNGRPGQIGSGVQVTRIKRKADELVNAQLLASHEERGKYDAASTALARLERLFGDSQDQSLGSDLNDLFAAFQDVATSPSDLTARSTLLSKAQALVDRFHQADRTLVDERQGLDRQVAEAITDVNRLAGQIADLNKKIEQAELSGQDANDLRDERQRLVNDLGALIDVSTVEDETGQISVFVGRGQVLIEKNRARTLSGVANASNNGLLDVQYDQAGISISSVIDGGRLRGLLDARDTTIPGLQGDLDILAANLVSRVNAQHQVGYGLDGSTGLDFFTAGGLTARTIAVALSDRRKIAASDSAAGVPGNNVNALALADLQHAPIAALGGSTVSGYYEITAAGIGSAAKKAAHDLEAQELVQEQLEAHWAEVSGVSLDEELINMMKYQRAFQAASKIITMTDELLQTILAIKR